MLGNLFSPVSPFLSTVPPSYLGNNGRGGRRKQNCERKKRKIRAPRLSSALAMRRENEGNLSQLSGGGGGGRGEGQKSPLSSSSVFPRGGGRRQNERDPSSSPFRTWEEKRGGLEKISGEKSFPTSFKKRERENGRKCPQPPYLIALLQLLYFRKSKIAHLKNIAFWDKRPFPLFSSKSTFSPFLRFLLLVTDDKITTYDPPLLLSPSLRVRKSQCSERR